MSFIVYTYLERKTAEEFAVILGFSNAISGHDNVDVSDVLIDLMPDVGSFGLTSYQRIISMGLRLRAAKRLLTIVGYDGQFRAEDTELS